MAQCIRLVSCLFLVKCIASGAELTGIWMGAAPGRNGEPQDVAFQFKRVNGILSGVMFSEEFDLPVQGLKIEGDNVSFSVTATNYYSGNRLTMIYAGTVSAKELKLSWEPKEPPANDRQRGTQTLILQRVTSQPI